MWKAVLLLMLAGCAAEPQVVQVLPEQAWWKPEGFPHEDLVRDSGACRAQAFSIPDAQPDRIRIVYEGCLQGMGYRLHPSTPH